MKYEVLKITFTRNSKTKLRLKATISKRTKFKQIKPDDMMIQICDRDRYNVAFRLLFQYNKCITVKLSLRSLQETPLHPRSHDPRTHCPSILLHDVLFKQ